MDYAIQVENVWKKFRKGESHDSLRELIPAAFKRLLGHRPPADQLRQREFWALKDVSFQVKRGESLGIIGPNGAGKSTMLKLLSRILKPNRGTYNVQGRVSALIEVGAGFHPDLSGRENIYLNGAILGMSKSEIKSKEEAIIDFAGIESFIDTPVKRYSSGMSARLGFSVAAHMVPDVLLVDEVLSVGDARFRQKCILHMKQLIASDVTVIFISHILEQVRMLCPRTLVLDQGAIAYEGETEGAIRKYLDLLTSEPAADEGAVKAELRDIRFCDEAGEEVDVWTSGTPNRITCELVLHETIDNLSLVINLATTGGVHVGTANTRLADFPLPQEPGVYTLTYQFDPLPLCDGEFGLDFKINHRGGARAEVVWYSRQPRVISVRGAGIAGGLLTCPGQWSLSKRAAPPRAVAGQSMPVAEMPAV